MPPELSSRTAQLMGATCVPEPGGLPAPEPFLEQQAPNQGQLGTPEVENINALARSLHAQHRLRALRLGNALFADPAWDILLTLFNSDQHGESSNVETLCSELKVNTSTARRFVNALADLGLVQLQPNSGSEHEPKVSLSDRGRVALQQLLEEMLKGSRTSLAALF